MTKFVWAISAGLVVTLLGILTDVPLVVAFGALGTFGLTLVALLTYFETAP